MGSTRNNEDKSAADQRPIGNGTMTIFLLGTGEKYYNPADPRNDPQNDAYDKKFAKKAIKKQSIHTSFYEACEGEKLLLDGPQGTRDPVRIAEMVQLSADAVQKFVSSSPPGTNEKYRININGFSRGGTCCTRVANKLQDMLDKGELKDSAGKTLTLKDIEVNICASDPVAGLFDKKDKDVKDIPPIVSNYAAILQINEKRRAFLPEDLSRVRVIDPNNTQVTFLPMYGNHSETNKVKSAEVKHSALLHYNIKFAFLSQHGTKFKDNQLPAVATSGNPDYLKPEDSKIQSPEMLLEYYAGAKAKKDLYEKRGNDYFAAQTADVPGKKNDRSFATTYKADYVKDDFFVNQHERELFKKVYPKVFNTLFERDTKDNNDPHNTGGIKNSTNRNGGYSNKELHVELDRLFTNNPQLTQQLFDNRKITKGFLSKSHPYLLTSGGTPFIEPCRYLNSTSGLPVAPLTLAELLRAKLSEDIFSLKREKGDIANFEAGMKLREKLDTITSRSGTTEEKFDEGMRVLTEAAHIATKSNNQVQLKLLSDAISFASTQFSKPDDKFENIVTLDRLSRMTTALEIELPKSDAKKAAKELAMAATDEAPPLRSQRQRGLREMSGTASAVTETLVKVAQAELQKSTSATPPTSAAKAAAKKLAREPLEVSPSIRRQREISIAERSGVQTAVADTASNRVSSQHNVEQDKSAEATSRIRIGGR